MTTIQNIFREIMPPEHSFSEARRQIHMDGVKFNGEQVTSMDQEVDVQEGSVFKVGKRAIWQREGGKWIRLTPAAKWASNMIQFPRLISEIAATQNLDLQVLADSMDLILSELDELFERADTEWELIKKRHLTLR